MDASQQDGPHPDQPAHGRGGPGASAGGSHARRAARKQPGPQQQQPDQAPGQSGQASAFRRALDAQAETTGLVPSAPHDLTQPIPRVQIGEDEFSFPVAPVVPAGRPFDPAFDPAAATRPVGPAPDELAPPSRVPAWLPPVQPAERARLTERGFPAGPAAAAPAPAPTPTASQLTALSHLSAMPEPATAAETTALLYPPPAAPEPYPTGTLVIPPSQAAATAEAGTALVKPPPGFAAVPTAPSPRHSGRSRRDRVLLLVGACVAMAIVLGVSLMLVNGGGTPMNPMAPSALPSQADPSRHPLIAGAGPSGSAAASPSASAGDSASASPSASPVATGSPSASATASTQPAAQSPSPSPAKSSAAPAQQAACSVTFSVASSWTDNYQLNFTVTGTGTEATRSWTVSLVLPDEQTATEVWNAQAEQIGQTVVANSDSYDGQLSPGGTADWGLQVRGSGKPPSPTSRSTDLTCSAQ